MTLATVPPRRVRASSSARFVKCPGHALLPACTTSSVISRTGTAMHEIFARLVQSGPEAARTNIPAVAAYFDLEQSALLDLMPAAEKLWAENSQFFPNPRCEHPMEMELPGVTITGTSDLVSIIPGSIAIADVKSGFSIEGDHRAQLRTYAALAYEEAVAEVDPFGPDDQLPDRVYASIFWLRDWSAEGYWFTKDELEAWLKALQDAAKSEDLRIGEHCRYCPVMACPALQARVTGLIPWVPALTPETAAEIHAAAKAISARVDEAENAIRAMVRNSGPITFDEVRQLVIRDEVRQSITMSEEAEKIILEAVGPEGLRGSVSVKKTELLNAVKSRYAKGKAAAANDFMDLLQKAGAVTETVIEKLVVANAPAKEASA